MQLKDNILKLKKENPTWGHKRIADALSCNPSTVKYHLSPHYKKICLNNMKKTRVRRSELRAKLVQEAGGKCIVCGYDKFTGAIDFHHLNPTSKEVDINTLLRYAKERAREEVKKCILLCCRCHREFHGGIINLNFLKKKEEGTF